MSIRRRLAMWLDPGPTTTVVSLDWDTTRELHRIAEALKSIDRKTAKRRPRVIECRHPELHEESEA